MTIIFMALPRYRNEVCLRRYSLLDCRLVEADVLHADAMAITMQLGNIPIVTSEMVLTEVLNDCGTRGQYYRVAAANTVADLQTQNMVRIIPQTAELFAHALELYRQRPDKQWSLTDCASMVICQQEGITEVLTYDHHFQQAGMKALLREEE